MYCLSCGAQFADDRKFCPECGTPAAQTGERTIIPGGMGMTHIMGSGSMENDFPQVSSGGTEDKVFVETRVTRAEINFSGATIFREGKAELKAGDNRIYLKVALGMVSRESMVIDFARPIRSCSISGQEIITPEMTEEEKARIAELEKEIASIEAKQSIYTAQENAYRKNSDFSSRNNVTVAESMEYLAKLPEILEGIASKQEELNAQKEDLCRERDEINNAERKSFSCIPVDVNVSEEGEYEFTFHYYDRQVSWKPFYDIHVENLASPIDFAFKGTINQNTGEDWTDVETALICGNLSVSNNQPVLNPWRLDFVRQIPHVQASMPRNAMMAAPAASMGMQKAASMSEDTVMLSRPKAEKKTMETMESYVLPEKQVIRSGSRGSIVDITDITVQADYIFTTTPKLEPSVFLTARIRDIGIYNLYECRANIYLEGTYIGQITLDPDPTKDYNELSLGRDSQISVTRKNTRKFTEKHRRNTEHMAYEYEITVINQKNEPAVIQIRDQIPVSMNQDIKIENVDTSQGTLDPQTGEVTWFYTFQPNMPAVLKLAYSIVWPKGTQLDM